MTTHFMLTQIFLDCTLLNSADKIQVTYFRHISNLDFAMPINQVFGTSRILGSLTPRNNEERKAPPENELL